MPGIFGLITKQPAEVAARQLSVMAGVMKHEAWYSTGRWADERYGIYIGWTALAEESAIRKVADGRLLVTGGEPGFAGDPAYDTDGHFMSRWDGLFHGVLVDPRNGEVELFNDRYGMRRIYYLETGDSFYFSAEAKAILAVRPEQRTLNAQGLADWLSCGCVIGEHSLFGAIGVLPTASHWTVCRAVVVRRRTYFSAAEWEGQDPCDANEYYQKLREGFLSALSRCLAGTRQVGISLTGGFDSRMIASWLPDRPDAYPCYSFGGMFRECHDVRLAKAVAELRGQKHHVIRVGEEFLSDFARLAGRTIYLSDGCTDVSHSADLYVNARARAIAPVRVTGNYGGEVLRGFRAFKPGRLRDGVFSGELAPQLHASALAYAEASQVDPVSFAGFRQAPWHHYGLYSLESTQITMRSPFLSNAVVRSAYLGRGHERIANDVAFRLIGEGSPTMLGLPTDRGLRAKAGFGDRFDRAVLDFLTRAEYAFDYGMPQWLARAEWALSPLRVERLFLGRNKFYHYRTWYRRQLSKSVREILLDSKSLSRPYLVRKAVEGAVMGHTSGHGNFTRELHKLLTMELIHRRLIDSVVP